MLKILFVASALGSGCSGRQVPPLPAATAQSPRTPWVKVRSAEGLPMLEAPARVLGKPEAMADVVPPFRARVVRIHVRPGQHIEQGGAIMDVVMPEVARAAGAYVAATTRLQAYGKHKEQLQALRGEGMVRLSDLAEAENRVAEALADQQGALGTLRGANLSGSDAARLLGGSGELTLRSPIAGVVTAVRATLGETHENSDLSLAQVAGTGPTQDVQIEARLARPLPAGAVAEFVSPAGDRVPLRALSSAPIVDPRDGTTLTWFAPAEPRAGKAATPTLLPGLQGRLQASLAGLSGVVAVPSRALLLQDGRAYVRVRRVDRPEKLPVEVLSSSGADALVRGVLSSADEVAADANTGEEEGR